MIHLNINYANATFSQNIILAHLSNSCGTNAKLLDKFLP